MKNEEIELPKYFVVYLSKGIMFILFIIEIVIYIMLKKKQTNTMDVIND